MSDGHVSECVGGGGGACVAESRAGHTGPAIIQVQSPDSQCLFLV